MIRLFDVLLPRPLPGFLYQPLEFLFFVGHFFFVLLTVGTALFAVINLYRRLWAGGSAEPGRLQATMPVYFASKSLMITFGIAVLLLVMSYYSVAFTAAANLNAGIWLSVIVVLSAALVILEVSENKSRAPVPRAAFAAGLAGLALLLLVPAIFVAFVVTAENPGRWADYFRGGLSGASLAGHWLARLLHVYGAAAVVAGMFYLARSARTGRKPPAGPNLVFGALMAQVVLGILLYMSLPSKPGPLMNAFVVAGAAAAVWFAWFMFSGRALRGGTRLLPAMLALILIPMLLARQINQEQVLAPFDVRLKRNAAAHRSAVRSAGPAANPFFTEQYSAHNMPQFMFQRSCAFCHGGVGDGRGREAGNLNVRPADLTQVRVRRPALLKLLRDGVPGSAMPYFSVYTGGALRGLSGYLYRKVGMREELEPPAFTTGPRDEAEAASVFERQCASCHGSAGRTTAAGKKLRPAPRDMTDWALSPDAALRAITDGVPGTSMKGYAALPEGIRRALVKRAGWFYTGRKSGY